MGILKGHFDKLMRKAFSVHAKKLNASEQNLEIVFCLQDKETPAFLLLLDGRGVKTVKAKELLNVVIDFHNKSDFLQIKTVEILSELAAANNIQWNHIRLIIRQEKEFIKAALWNNQVCIKQDVDLGEILDDTKLLEEHGTD